MNSILVIVTMKQLMWRGSNTNFDLNADYLLCCVKDELQ